MFKCKLFKFFVSANYILLDTIEKIHSGLGNRVTVQYPTSKSRANLDWAKKDVCKRLVSIFLPDVSTGARPLHGMKICINNLRHFIYNIVFILPKNSH